MNGIILASTTLGSNVGLLDSEEKLKEEFGKTKFRWNDGMRPMMGKCYAVIKHISNTIVGLPSADGSQGGVWYFPTNVLCKCKGML